MPLLWIFWSVGKLFWVLDSLHLCFKNVDAKRNFGFIIVRGTFLSIDA